MKAQLIQIDKIASNIHTFWFKPEQLVRYTAGQYIEMFLPHQPVDERGERHWFTLSSSPTEPLLAITTKFSGESSSSFKKTLWHLKPGTELHITEPMGDFVLPKDSRIPLIFVAGGIGITPYRSIIKWITDTHQKRDIHLLYGANNPDELVFTDIFYGYDLTFIPLVTQLGWSGETGRLSAETILRLTPPTANSLVYISGPEPMVEVISKDLEKYIAKSQIVTDFFLGYTTI